VLGTLTNCWEKCPKQLQLKLRRPSSEGLCSGGGTSSQDTMLLLLHPHAAPLHLSLPLSKSRMLMMPRIFVSSEHVCPLETEMVLSSRKLKMLMCPQCRDKAVL